MIKPALKMKFSFAEWHKYGHDVIRTVESNGLIRDKTYFRQFDTELGKCVNLFVYDEQLFTLLKLKFSLLEKND